MMLVSLISYIDRSTLAVLAPTILHETGLSDEQYGYVISAFSIAYMAGNPIWGRVLDQVGLRIGMTAAVSLWTIASAAHAFAGGLFGFAGARFLLGFGEGATFPGGLRAVIQTLPPASRSRGVALAYSGGSLGAVLTPIIVTPIALRWGWRGAFWFTGLAGTLWLVLWLIESRKPELARSPRLNSVRGEPLDWLDPKLWSFVFLYSLGGLPLAFVLYEASLFLSGPLHQDQLHIGRVLWIPPLGWECGYFFWGWITDRFASHGASHTAMRRLLGLLALLSLPFAAVPQVAGVPAAMAAMFFAMFVAGGFVIAAMSYATNAFPSSQAGLVAGLGAGSWSALVAVVMPMFGRLFDQHRYDLAFAIAAALPLIGFLAWDTLNRGRVS